jgi:hypothetical protein
LEGFKVGEWWVLPSFRLSEERVGKRSLAGVIQPGGFEKPEYLNREDWQMQPLKLSTFQGVPFQKCGTLWNVLERYQ